MEHQLPPLPFSKTALEPHMSAETLEFHHGKHHDAYVKKLNELIKGTEFQIMPLEEIIRQADGAIYNNAAQHWNHSFFWKCLSPKSSGAPDGKIAEAILRRWGDFEKFKRAFTEKAVANFGSGWTWLVLDKKGKLDIVNTSNAYTPIGTNKIPLLTLDVWEHAYYLDHRNSRPDFINAFWSLVNWEFVNSNLSINQDFKGHVHYPDQPSASYS